MVLVGVIGVYSVCVVDIMPIMLTSWVHGLGISERVAGLIATANFAGAAAGQICAFLLLTRLSISRIAAIGLIIAATGDGGCILMHSAIGLALLRAVGGFGHAFVMIAVINWLARHRHADRGFGAFMVLQVAVVSPLLIAVPAIQSIVGAPAPYLLLLGLALVSLILRPLLNLNGGDVPLAQAIAPDPASGTRAGSGKSNLPMMLAVAAPTLFAVAVIGDWSYLQRYGVSAGLNETGLAGVLAAVMLTGIPAGALVIWLGKRIGRTLPIVAGVIAITVPIVMFTIDISSLAAFAVASAVFNIAWCICVPYFQAIQADLDPTGRLAAIGNFPVTIGTAIGPAIFASMLGGSGYRGAFLVTLALFACSLVAVVPPAITADRGLTRLPSPSPMPAPPLVS